jgi:hypothetical protein
VPSQHRPDAIAGKFKAKKKRFKANQTQLKSTEIEVAFIEVHFFRFHQQNAEYENRSLLNSPHN